MVAPVSIFASLVALVLGCAAHPASVVPLYVSERNYEGWSCEKLTAEHSDVDERFQAAYKAQLREANADAAGVLLLGVPAGSMGSADLEPQIAQYKGILATIEKINEREQCGIEPADIPERPVNCNQGNRAKRKACRRARSNPQS